MSNTESIHHVVNSYGEEITISMVYTREGFCVSTMTRLPAGCFIVGERKLYPTRNQGLMAWHKLVRTTH
jgi:hypothetical protein